MAGEDSNDEHVPIAAFPISVEVNGEPTAVSVEPSQSLMDFLRERGCTGVHSGCEHGVCGACTVLMEGQPVRSCIVLAVQADGCAVETVESLGSEDEPHPLQVAFSQRSGLQCGFCTPGFLMLANGLLRENPKPDECEIREALSSNLCRCTGYESIVQAVQDVSCES